MAAASLGRLTLDLAVKLGSFERKRPLNPMPIF